jgi:hypothetical protein
MNAFENTKPNLRFEKKGASSNKPRIALLSDRRVHVPKLTVAPQQEHAIGETNFQREQQRDHLHLLPASVREVAVEHRVAAASVARKAVLSLSKASKSVNCSF